MKVIHRYKVDNYKFKTGPITRSKAIRLFCIECMGWQPHLIPDCPSNHCVLYPYRMGPGQVDKSQERVLQDES